MGEKLVNSWLIQPKSVTSMRSSRSVKIQSENLINNDWPKYEGLELFLQLGTVAGSNSPN